MEPELGGNALRGTRWEVHIGQLFVLMSNLRTPVACLLQHYAR
jgi:hypothetical protein